MQKICKTAEDIPFYQRQSRFVLNKCGAIDPEDIKEYIAHNGYLGALKACTEMNSEEICKTITASGLRGRGGGGFPTGKKWDMARMQLNEKIRNM